MFFNNYVANSNPSIGSAELFISIVDKITFVVSDLEFVKLYKKATSVLVCIFNKNLYTGLTFLEDFNDLVLLDGSKTRKEIMLDLKSSFKNTLGFRQQFSESISSAFMHKKPILYVIKKVNSSFCLMLL